MSPRPLRIVHVSAYFAPAWAFGGPPRSLLTLCQAQVAAGLAIEVFTTTANPGATLAASPEGQEVEGVRARYFPLSRPARLMGAASMADPLAHALARADVAHLHGLFNRTVWMASRLARRAGVPVVVSPRGMLQPAALAHHAWRKRASWLLHDRQVLRHAACWHATSDVEAHRLARHGGVERVVEIPNVVPTVAATAAEIRLARAVAALPEGVPFILFLGRVHPIKRLDLLADAFGSVAVERPDVHLVLAGPDEAGHRARVEPRFASSRNRVRWAGAVDQRVKAGLVAGASALVACSDSESFGMSIAEALSAGTPVVATHTCPWALLERERCGWWVPQQPGDIAAALRRILSDADEARARGARGRACAAAHFSPAAVASAWRSVYERLASSGPSSRSRFAA